MHRSRLTMNRNLIVLLAVLWIPFQAVGAEQVIFRNGDRLTGRIVSNDGKVVEIETAYWGVLAVPLNAIEDVAEEVKLKGREPSPVVAALFSAQETIGLTDLWVADLDAAFSLTDGNSDTRAINIAMRAARDTDRDRSSLYFTSVFANNAASGASITTANAVRGGGRYEIDVSDRLFTFGFSDLEFDRFQGLDLRLVLGGGLGVHVVDRPRNDFRVFSGGSSNLEYFDSGSQRRSGEFVLGEEWNHALTDSTSLEERLAVFSNLSQFGQYRMTFDSALLTRLNNWLSWQVTVSDRYLSNPRDGKKPNDLLFTTGIRITLGEGDLQNVGPSVIDGQ